VAEAKIKRSWRGAYFFPPGDVAIDQHSCGYLQFSEPLVSATFQADVLNTFGTHAERGGAKQAWVSIHRQGGILAANYRQNSGNYFQEAWNRQKPYSETSPGEHGRTVLSSLLP
jgi:hypothetical protein